MNVKEKIYVDLDTLIEVNAIGLVDIAEEQIDLGALYDLSYKVIGYTDENQVIIEVNAQVDLEDED